MDSATAFTTLLSAGFRRVGAIEGYTYAERPAGPFHVEVIHDQLNRKVSLYIRLRPDGRYRPWSVPLAKPEDVLDEALNFIRVFESSACVGGD
jgi:hypothetical protein